MKLEETAIEEKKPKQPAYAVTLEDLEKANEIL